MVYDPKAEALATVAKIRELIKKGMGTNEIARQVGWSRARVSHVRVGRNYANSAIKLDTLKFVKSDKLCRRCGEPAIYVSTAYQLLCIRCTVTELVKLKVIKLQERRDNQDDSKDKDLATVAKIRELIKEGLGTSEIARRVGWSRSRVSHVRVGRTYSPSSDLDDINLVIELDE